MKNQVSWAIAIVSSNNKTNILAVKAIAEKLGAVILPNRQWDNITSNRRGASSRRGAISEVVAYCKKYSRVRYLIIAEPGIFFRSVKEIFYLESELKRLGIKIYSIDGKELF